MNRRLASLLIFLLGVAAISPGARAALSLSNMQSLAFGMFAAGAGGSIHIAPDGTRSKSGAVTLFSMGEAGAAEFLVSDDDPANAERAYNIYLPAEGSIINSDGTASITLTDFVSTPVYQGRLTNGMQRLRVGASLQVPPGLPPGNYAGTFSVTVIYQ